MDIEKNKNILSIFELMFEKKITASYVGAFYNDILSLIAETLENGIIGTESIKRKIFRIFIELAQNIAFYSAYKEELKGKQYGYGTFMLIEDNDYFLLITGNLVTTTDKKLLDNRINEINKLDRTELRDLKRRLRKKENRKGAGNIGLTQIALLSRNKLIHQFNKEDDKYFFMLCATINKN